LDPFAPAERVLESLSADHEELRRSRRQLADVLAALD
jgi:hypothetical protein